MRFATISILAIGVGLGASRQSRPWGGCETGDCVADAV
jgi:hypothetical protein